MLYFMTPLVTHIDRDVHKRSVRITRKKQKFLDFFSSI